MARSGSTGTVATESDEGNPGNTLAGYRVEGDWEYRPVQLSSDVSRMTAAVRLAIQAEFGGWELVRLRLYPGGVRKVWLRRRRTSSMLPEPSI